MEKIVLPPANGLTGQLIGKGSNYQEYEQWRYSPGYKAWLKKQWRRQQGKCFYCDISLKGMRHNVEHVMPMSQPKRYTNQARNFVLSCAPCNKDKGSTKPSVETRKRVYKLNKKYKN